MKQGLGLVGSSINLLFPDKRTSPLKEPTRPNPCFISK